MAAGMVINMAIITLNTSALFPMPEGLDQADPEQMNSYFATLPAMAFVAAKIAESKPMLLAMLVGTFTLAGGVYMMLLIEGPSWMVIELPLYLVTAWLGCKLARPAQPDAYKA